MTTDTTAAPLGSGRIRAVRKMTFRYPGPCAHWNTKRPEFSQIINAGSLAMPYLEPYLIRTMAKLRPQISDPALLRDIDAYMAQETTHYRQHKAFNATLAAAGYESVPRFEAVLARDYKRFGEERSLLFNLAYAEGFESMALAIGHMVVEDREYLFGGGDPGVVSLVLWHFVEEIEHKNVAFDAFHAAGGGYFGRVFGLAFATGHIFWRTGQGYRALLKEDGLWRDWRSRWRLLCILGRVLRKLTPKLLRILSPAYHPKKLADPDWVTAWWSLYGDAPEKMGRLDTDRLAEEAPALMPA